MLYKNKFPYIEAYRFKIDEEEPQWFKDKANEGQLRYNEETGVVIIRTPIGHMRVPKGDYIVLDRLGNLAHAKKETFEDIYMKVDIVE